MSDLCVHQLLEEQADRTPHAVAVVWGGGTLTFRELNEQANRLANLLGDLGVRPERLVAVTTEPSPLLLVTMLAIWKAGGVYVPLDPSVPHEMAERTLVDAGVSVLVRNGPDTVDAADIPVVDLAGLHLADQPATAPTVAVSPANLAYCVFTSGSTGKPKPVAVQHDSFVNHGYALRDQLGLRAQDRVLQSTAMAFDAALEEILPAWLAGAAVVMPDSRRFTPVEFTELIDRLAVTMVSLPSAYWHQWVDDLVSGLLRLPEKLRIVFIGGDKILVEKLAAWYQIPGADAIDWVSDYGPTETSISVTLYRPEPGELAAPDASGYALVPIGLPFAGARLYVLDAALKPVPDDEPGDLWVGGPPVSRGYHGNPVTTADRFLPDPQGLPGARMYRTGDRASRRPDGTLIFLGRSDRQIKVRGQRVEPGQVESAVHHCAGVRDAVVIAVEDPPFGSRLIAYIEAEPSVSEAALRADMAKRLPPAMVPGSVVLMDRIPRSPLNGKVARAQLPTPPPVRAAAENLAGMTTLERVVAGLAGEVLGGQPVHRDEDFFAAGGDSLRSMQFLSRVTEVTGIVVTFAQFRTAPTVEAIARLVRGERGRAAPNVATSGAVVPTGGDHGARRIASRGQQALWFLNLVHRGAPVYSIPVCYRIRGPLDLTRLDAALTTIVGRHEALRTVFEEQDGTIYQRVRPATPMRTEVRDVTDADEAVRLAQEESARPFDLVEGPLLRSVCFRVDDEESYWLLNVHHAVFDAWSLAIFWRELAELYGGRSLPEPSAQYSDYSAWQEQWLRGPEAEGQRAYWRSRLAGDPPSSGLGVRRRTRGRVGTEGFALPHSSDVVDPESVRRLARAERTTVFAVLLAALFAALRRTGDADEAVVGVGVACRNRPGTEEMIGYLVNTVAVRVSFKDGMCFRELIGCTDEALTEALTHQDLPFAEAVEGLPRSSGGRNPLFEAMFSLQSTPLDDHGGIEGLDIAEVFVHQGTAKVPVTWGVRQEADFFAGEVEYSADHFDRDEAQRWQETLLTVLAGAVADPEALIDELPGTVVENSEDSVPAVAEREEALPQEKQVPGR